MAAWGGGMRTIIALLGLALLLGGCGKANPDCGSDASKAAVTDMIKTAIEDGVRAALDKNAQLAAYDRSKLSAALSKMGLELKDVRTTRTDPNSSRKFCSAKVSISFSDKVIKLIDDTRTAAELESRSNLANRAGIEHDATGLAVELEYSVQPTDDGSKLIAESDAFGPSKDVLAEMFSSYLLSDEVRQAKIAADQEESQRLTQEQAIATASESAQRQLSVASMQEAQAENRLAVQRIGAVWRAILPATRNRLAPIQTAWNKRITAQCTVESSGQTTDPDLFRAAKLQCETRALQARASELERFATYNNNDTATAAEDAAEAAIDAAREAAKSM